MKNHSKKLFLPINYVIVDVFYFVLLQYFDHARGGGFMEGEGGGVMEGWGGDWLIKAYCVYPSRLDKHIGVDKTCT